MAIDPNRVNEIFLEAANLSDPAARSAYLDRACGGDAALRQQVEALLAAHAGTGRFLEPAPAGSPEDPTDRVPDAAGSFDSEPPTPTELETGAQLADEAADALNSPLRSESGS